MEENHWLMDFRSPHLGPSGLSFVVFAASMFFYDDAWGELEFSFFTFLSHSDPNVKVDSPRFTVNIVE